jgi:carbon-monoxide dehydrogenase medium subunit
MSDLATQGRFFAPEDYAEAAQIKAEYLDGARILAGGQSLTTMMRLGFVAPDALISLRRVAGSTGMTRTGTAITLGPRVTTAEMSRSVHRRALPVVGSAAGQIASPHVRNIGTVVGNICHADPGNDLAAAMLCHEARCVVTSSRGERTVPVEDLLAEPYALALDDDEFVSACVIPRLDGWRGSYRKVVWRGSDHPVAAAAVALSVRGRTVVDARVAVGSSVLVATRIRAMEGLLRGVAAPECGPLLAQAPDQLSALTYLDDPDMPAAYRQRITAVLVADAVRDCLGTGG